MSNNSIWPRNKTLSDTTIPDRSDGNEGVLRIPQSSSITGVSPSDCLMSYTGPSLLKESCPSVAMQSVYSSVPTDSARHSLGESYPSVEMESVYSTSPADWVDWWRRVDPLS